MALHGPSTAEIAMLLDAALDNGLEQPCRTHDPDLWFAEAPADLERAKQLCRGCPVRAECLAGALARRESYGVWGGEIFHHGVVLPRKRPRGRPRKRDVELYRSVEREAS
ncbi:MAG: WhiB family transcriptional regulator [Pseudonocardiaceae bacterium]